MGLVQKIFGTHSQHELKRIYPIADKVESYREEYGKLSDEQLKGKTKEFKERLSKGETLNDLLPEAYATVREAAKRVLGMEHYSFYEEFSPKAFLKYMAEIKGVKSVKSVDEAGNVTIKKVNQQIDELLEVVNLTSVAYKKIGGFSGGMKQRVLLECNITKI